MLTILRAYVMYKPLKCFTYLASIPSVIGLLYIIRFLIYYIEGTGSGHVQSLILGCTLLIMGFLTVMIGIMADVISANRKILEDTQYHVRRAEYEALYRRQQRTKQDAWAEAKVQSDAEQIEEEQPHVEQIEEAAYVQDAS